MDKIFGTDGIRSKFGYNALNIKYLQYIIIAIHLVLKKDNNAVIVASDTRLSCFPIINNITSILQFFGVKIIQMGIVTTPCLSFLTKKIKSDYAIMITASHNHHEYNGIKIFDKSGYKISKSEEQKIEYFVKKLINDEYNYSSYIVSSENIYKISNQKYKVDLYKNYVINKFKKLINLPENFSIIFDCANGSSTNLIKDIIQNFCTNVKYINDKPNGLNINLKCGSTYPTAISNEVKKHSASLGMAFDGDGDRILICNSNGKIITGDQLIAMIAVFQKNNYNTNSIVINETSVENLKVYLREKNIDYYITDVGDKNIITEMIKRNTNIGGERSGHIILPESVNHSSDGIITALKILEIYSKNKDNFEQILLLFKENTRLEYNFNYKYKKEDFDSIINCDFFKEKINDIKKEIGNNGKILIRKSGTEDNLIRIILESSNKKDDNFLKYKLDDIIVLLENNKNVKQ